MLMEENPGREEIRYREYYLDLFKSQLEDEPIERALARFLNIGLVSTISDRQTRELVREMAARNERDAERWPIPTWGGKSIYYTKMALLCNFSPSSEKKTALVKSDQIRRLWLEIRQY